MPPLFDQMNRHPSMYDSFGEMFDRCSGGNLSGQKRKSNLSLGLPTTEKLRFSRRPTDYTLPRPASNDRRFFDRRRRFSRRYVRMTRKHFLLLLIIFVTYMIIGSVIFMNIEKHESQSNTIRLAEAMEQFEQKLTQHGLNLSTPGMVELMTEVQAACLAGLCDNGDFTNQTEPTWQFYNAVFFTLTVLTTIGYGKLAPSTPEGQTFCIIYAIVGVPLSGILFASIGDFFSSFLLRFHERSKLAKGRRLSHEKWNLILSSVLYLIPGMLIFIFVPALVFSHMEQWSYIEGVYFAFITLCTIGFGDYVAGHQSGTETSVWVYKIGVLLWIVVGLGYLSMILNFVAKVLRATPVTKLEQSFTRSVHRTQQALSEEFDNIVSALNKFANRITERKDSLRRTSSLPSINMSPSELGSRTNSDTDLYMHSEGLQERTETIQFVLEIAKTLAEGGGDNASFLSPMTNEERARLAGRRASIAQLASLLLLPHQTSSSVNSPSQPRRTARQRSMSIAPPQLQLGTHNRRASVGGANAANRITRNTTWHPATRDNEFRTSVPKLDLSTSISSMLMFKPPSSPVASPYLSRTPRNPSSRRVSDSSQISSRSRRDSSSDDENSHFPTMVTSRAPVLEGLCEALQAISEETSDDNRSDRRSNTSLVPTVSALTLFLSASSLNSYHSAVVPSFELESILSPVGEGSRESSAESSLNSSTNSEQLLLNGSNFSIPEIVIIPSDDEDQVMKQSQC